MSIYKYYYDAQRKYSEIYGEKTIVFMQIGTFHEAYNDNKNGFVNLRNLEPLLNCKYIDRQLKKYKKSDANMNKPNQLGFPSVGIVNQVSKLVDAGYTVVIFNQCKYATDDERVIERELSGIYSPGTLLNDKQLSDSNYLMCVYICEEPQLSKAKSLMAIGITLIDVSTGTSMVHEFYSNVNDDKFGLDELLRIIQTFKPTETVIYYHCLEIDNKAIENIKNYLELSKITHFFYIYHNKVGNDKTKLLLQEYFKINYQNDYLAKIFEMNYKLSLSNNLSPLETLSLVNKPYATISLIIIIRYISEHNVLLLKNLMYPTVYIYTCHLILGNNAVEQLNIVDTNSLEVYDKKIKSLFDVVNRTFTPMGKRFLKQNLLNPLSQENKTDILKRYNIIDKIQKHDLMDKLKAELKTINDMERLHRKMALGLLVPYEMYRLDTFYQSSMRIIQLIKTDDILTDLLSLKTVGDFMEYQLKYTKIFDCEILQNYNNFNDIDCSFFVKNICPEIDELQDKIDYTNSVMTATLNYFKNILAKKCKPSKNNIPLISISKNENDGYFFNISRTRETILKAEITNLGKKIYIDLADGNRLTINREDVIFKGLKKGATKIFIAPLIEYTISLSKNIQQLSKLIEKNFIKHTLDFYSKHKSMLYKISKFIAEIDFLNSGAIVAKDYYYTKPIIKSNTKVASYFVAHQLRHAIIERLCRETEYVPNDISLGNVPADLAITNGASKAQAHQCLDPNTPVLMYNGGVKRACEIVVGNQLMGDDSTPRRVLHTCKGEDTMYRIAPVHGDAYTVNGNHILCLKSSGYKSVMWNSDRENHYRATWMQNHVYNSKSFSVSKYGTKPLAHKAAVEFLKSLPSDRGKIIQISVSDYLKKPSQWRINYYTYHVGVDFPKRDVQIDPYILGHWLGDGNSSGTGMTTADCEIVQYYQNIFDGTGVIVQRANDKYGYSVGTGVSISGKNRNWYLNSLKNYNLIDNKHIPRDYLQNDRKTRLAVLAGLIDSDGSNHGDCGIDIIQKNRQLAIDICYLARSLGFWCDVRKCSKTCANSATKAVGTYYRMYISGNDFSELPLLLEYKRPHSENKTAKLDSCISSFKIQKLGVGTYCGFQLDANHQFLLADFTVTHNSEIHNSVGVNIESSQSKSDQNGVLLFGLNSAGKTAMMKSIGIAIILAQIGYFVPAQKFIYEPYMAMYARITGNDNIFKGQSSFALEMNEIDAILKRIENNGVNTLIIGDEVCRGTESISGISLVAATLVLLNDSKCTYIFSSHLHDLPNIDEVKSINALRIYHLRVEYDEANDCLIFDRKLTPGSGPSVYGLMVARYFVKNVRFTNIADKIKKRLFGEQQNTLPNRTSTYNNKLIMNYCALCGYKPIADYHKELEAHHINFQKDCWKDGKIKIKPHLDKDELYNLVVVCRKCHEKIHRNEITIKGYQDTSIGPLLNYSRDKNKIIANGLAALANIESKKKFN